MDTYTRLRTTDVTVNLSGADENIAENAASAINASGSRHIQQASVTAEGTLTLAVERGTTFEDLDNELEKTLALGEESSFEIEAPEDYHENSPLALTSSGWRYQVLCEDCGYYHRDSDRPVIDWLCEDCEERYSEDEDEEDTDED